MSSSPSPVVAAAVRRSWPLAEKRRIVELTMQPGASVQSVAKKYQLDPPTLSSWRTLYRQGSLDILPDLKDVKKGRSEFIPVMVDTASTIKSPGPVILTMQIPNGITLTIEAETIDFEGLGSFVAGIKQST
jgi:transposase